MAYDYTMIYKYIVVLKNPKQNNYNAKNKIIIYENNELLNKNRLPSWFIIKL